MALRIAKLGKNLPRIDPRWRRDPRILLRVLLGVLLAGNLVAAFLVFRPIGGSAEELQQQMSALRRQFGQRQAGVGNLRALVAKLEKGRAEGDRFIAQHFLARRTAYSTLMAELGKSAQSAGIKPREHAFNFEPIEGSDTLGMLIVTANYEGSYADLVQFVNALDRSPRLLIVESLTAAPQQAGGTLNVAMRLNAFVVDDGSGPPPAPAPESKETTP
ncbi:MAG: type 4a pilus biogenesis protein PilO [Acidobacteria bacterium]|nr:type 4a pilus biogenesis protein PilO [Acidobacteriota bacterium]